MKNSEQAISVVGLGAGGHAKVVIEILRADSRFKLAGMLDRNFEKMQDGLMGVPVLGDDSLLPEMLKRGVEGFFIGVGGAGDNSPRRRLYELALAEGLRPVCAIHRQAIISASAQLGEGLTVMAGVIVNACAHIGANVIINSGAIIEHDCVVGDHVHIATGARLAGTVYVDEGAHVGVGASVRENVRVGRNSVVGAGTVVVEDVPDNLVVIGNPARALRKISKSL